MIQVAIQFAIISGLIFWLVKWGKRPANDVNWLVPLLIIAAISFVASWGAGDDNGVRYESDCSGVSRYDC